jgi:hypothetical protein
MWRRLELTRPNVLVDVEQSVRFEGAVNLFEGVVQLKKVVDARKAEDYVISCTRQRARIEVKELIRNSARDSGSGSLASGGRDCVRADVDPK